MNYSVHINYQLTGAVILSASPRAYVCNAGDRLELTCNTIESALQWRPTSKGLSGTPLISMLEISPVTEGLNGTLNITCIISLGPSTSMATTTVYFAGK